MKTIYLEAQKAKAYRKMVVEDGATPRGETPPPEHVEALDRADRLDRVEDVRRQHREGRGPPEWAGEGRGR